jgi:hypothetical protein
MEWSRSEIVGMSKVRCARCQGAGVRATNDDQHEPCNCVLRAVFRACYRRFVECASGGSSFGRVSVERGAAWSHSGGWGRKEEEYMADFCLVAKRTLTEEEHRVFRFHFLLGADYRLCCRQLKMDRGSFFHAVYRIQRKLGRAFKQMEPYPLFPLSDYFAGPQRKHAAKIVTMSEEKPKPPRIDLSWLKRAA